MSRNVIPGWWTAALLALLAGCAGTGTPAPQAKEEEEARQVFATFQKALKARDGDKLWSMLDADHQADAERAARKVRDAYAKATPAERAEQEKALGLPVAKLEKLDGAGFLASTRFIGMSAGEPVRDSGDLFGAVVQLARRICDAAEPSTILTSNPVRELCLGKGFKFADRGDMALKGFEEPVHVHEVAWL